MNRKKKKPDKPQRFQFNIGEVVIYVGGLYSKYKNKECVIVDKSKKRITEWYRVKFADNVEFETVMNSLKRKEESID